MWKNTQLGPLLIYFKRREAHKSSGRAECSQKAVDVWIASTASSLPSVFSPWLASVKLPATGTFQDHLQKEYRKDPFFVLPNTPVLFKWPLGLLIACLNKIQSWEDSPAVLRFCPFFLLQVYLFTFKSAEVEKFLIPQLSICPLKPTVSVIKESQIAASWLSSV